MTQPSVTDPELTSDTARAGQRAFVQAKLDAGDRLVCYKLGLTNRNKQQAMGIDSPCTGTSPRA